MTQTTIPITFDKSHLTTIGTRLYAESLDLVRELVRQLRATLPTMAMRYSATTSAKSRVWRARNASIASIRAPGPRPAP